MLQRFKNLTRGKKIIFGIIAFMLLPLTLLALSVELAYIGVKNKKIGKLVVGSLFSIMLIFSFANYGNEISKNENSVVKVSNNADSNKPKSEKEATLTKEELIKKLETYEGIYSVIPSAIQEAAKGTDKLEMQKTFADSRDILEKGWKDLGDLKKEYNSDSNEYRTIENLHLAFFTLRDACKNGITYLDKNEYKYFEKYEKNCSSAAAWMNDYLVYKEKI